MSLISLHELEQMTPFFRGSIGNALAHGVMRMLSVDKVNALCCESLGVEGDKPNGADARSSGELGVHKNWEAECKALLSSTTMSIQQIADTLNFPSQSVFGKYFKRATGMSPREYRNRG